MVIPTTLAGALLVTGQGAGLLGAGTTSGHALGQVQLAAADQAPDTDIVDADFRGRTGASWAVRYTDVISRLRSRVTNGNLTYHVMDERRETDYFRLRVTTDSGSTVLVINAENLYVVGYLNTETNVYHRMGDGPDNAIRESSGTPDSTTLTQGDYTYLERQAGRSRAGQQLTPQALDTWVSTLSTTPNSSVATSGNQAWAIMGMIQMFAEATRFDFISYNIGDSAANGNAFTPGTQVTLQGSGSGTADSTTGTATAIDFETNWSNLSRYLRMILDVAAPRIQYHISTTLTLYTIDAIRQQLAVAYNPKGNPPRRRLSGDTTSSSQSMTGVGAGRGAPDAGSGSGIGAAIASAVNNSDGTPNVSQSAGGVSFLGTSNPGVFTVAADGTGQYQTVQDAIDAVPSDGKPHTIIIGKGVYNETISVPKNRTHLTIEGATGNSSDVVITAGRAHGMTDPATGQIYGTQGSATATFRPSDLTVSGIKIVNSFDPQNHPEIDQYSTQAVAVAAMGDRQVYTNCQFIGIQDTVLAKSSAPTEQTRQYFSYDYITGSVDFVFGDATAVFDRDYLYEIDRGSVLGGNVVAPNTDSSKKYGLLIANSTLDSTAAANTFTLGRTWHNTSTAVGQTLVRNSLLPVGIKSAEPWTAIDPVNFPWTMGRFSEYHNGGAGSGVNSNRPQLSDSQAADYTTAAYLAGDDGWDPAW